MSELSRRNLLKLGGIGAAVTATTGLDVLQPLAHTTLGTAAQSAIPAELIELFINILGTKIDIPMNLTVPIENIANLLSSNPYSKCPRDFAEQALAMKGGILQILELNFSANPLDTTQREALNVLTAEGLLDHPKISRGIRRLKLSNSDWGSEDPHEISLSLLGAAESIDTDRSDLKERFETLQRTSSPNPLINSMIDDLIAVIRNPQILLNDPLVQEWLHPPKCMNVSQWRRGRCTDQYMEQIETIIEAKKLLPVPYFKSAQFRFPNLAQAVNTILSENDSVSIEYYLEQGDAPRIITGRYVTDKGITGDPLTAKELRELNSLIKPGSTDSPQWESYKFNSVLSLQ